MLEGGDEKKAARDKRKAAKLKRQAAWKSTSSTFSSSTSTVKMVSMWDDDDDDDDWGDYGGGEWSKYKSKEYINKYTITMDIKVLDEIPRDGLSLFQTELIHAKEDKRSGKLSFNKSDGECVVNQAGGVGMFGTFGDTSKARVEQGLWKRVTVAVQCTDKKEEKGELRTWVGAEPAVVIKEDTITANDRFALDPDGLYLFSSAKPEMMTASIAVRTVRVQMSVATDADVKANRARDKVKIIINEFI